MGCGPAVSARRQGSDVRQVSDVRQLRMSDVRRGSDVRKVSWGRSPVEAWRAGAGGVGRPLGFGRPRCRTSEVHRTSVEIANSLSWGFRTSEVCRTSDMSDVRSPSDVRRLEQCFCPSRPLSGPSVSDVRTGSDVRSWGLWPLHLGLSPLPWPALGLGLLLAHLPCT